MELKRFSSTELSWKLDFKPLKRWPGPLPVVAVLQGQEVTVIAGFERRTDAFLDVLILPQTSLNDGIEELWPASSLKSFERLRLEKILAGIVKEEALLQIPLELQNYLDIRDLPLKALKPLNYLGDFYEPLTIWILKLQPSSSQTREIFDILCDLHLQGISSTALAPQLPETHASAEIRAQLLGNWLTELSKKRTPRAFNQDQEAHQLLEKIPWPRGIKARWQRQGDQSGLMIQSVVTNRAEWLRLKSNIEKLQIGETLWGEN